MLEESTVGVCKYVMVILQTIIVPYFRGIIQFWETNLQASQYYFELLKKNAPRDAGSATAFL